MEKEKKKIKGRLLENFFPLHDNKTRKSTNVSKNVVAQVCKFYFNTKRNIRIFKKIKAIKQPSSKSIAFL